VQYQNMPGCHRPRRRSMRFIAPITIVRCVQLAYCRLSSGHMFFLPFLFLSPLLEKHVGLYKKRKCMTTCSLSRIKFFFFFLLQYIWSRIIYWVNIVFQFYPLIFNFYIKLGTYSLIAMYLVLNSLLTWFFFFNFIPWYLIFI
jgi:hypothetical protein